MFRWLEAPLTDDQRFNEARSYFPSCYSNEFHDCVEKAVVTAYPNCPRILELWGTNRADPVSKKLDEEIEKMPYCSAPTASSSSKTLLIVGAVGLALGVVIAKVLA